MSRKKKTLEATIPEGHSSGICPLCDNELREHDSIVRVAVRGTAHFVHLECMDEIKS